MYLRKLPISRRIFIVCNYMFTIILGILCLLPILNVFAISLSQGAAVADSRVFLWPVNFNLKSYEYAFSKSQFIVSLFTSIKRVVLGTSISMLLTVITAYPLAKEPRQFKWRTAYTWIFFITILFYGGLIPTYMVVRETGLIDKIWALVIPGAVPVFYIILLLNFFRTLPKELEESAYLDGAGHWTVLFKIFVPVSKAGLATILLFLMVDHWNEWFDGMIYMNKPSNYPLQTYLRQLIAGMEGNTMLKLSSKRMMEYYKYASNETAKAAQIFIGALPIMIAYPFLQKYFAKGIILGAVKG
jgi:putative aldouronate transport system permease protein